MKRTLWFSSVMKFVEKRSSFIAAVLLLFMFLFAFMSSAGNPFSAFSNPGDSATMDELAHIPSGYSYLKYKDYRLNPEHPPLFKDISALPLMFLDVDFPDTNPMWTEDINGQWGLGKEFLYHIGNNTDAILFWSRLPMMIVMVLLGVLIFSWAKKMWGPRSALLALVLYVFSPTITAHGRFVTTDVPIAFFTTLSFYGVWRFLQKPSWLTILFSGFLLGCAELTKFSAVLLIPLFIVFFVFYAIGRKETNSFHLFKSDRIQKRTIQNLYLYGMSLLLMFVVAFITIGAVYVFQVWNMPGEKIVELAEGSIYIERFDPIIKVITAFSQKNVVLRGYAQYFLGVSMVLQRATGGNTTFFLGEVNNQGWWYYFPVTFFLKEPLAFHFFWIFAVLVGGFRCVRNVFTVRSSRLRRSWTLLQHFISTRSLEFLMLLFVAAYGVSSIQSNLNIGVRHLMPIFPFIILLASRFAASFIVVGRFFRTKIAACIVLVLWLAISWIRIYPSYLTYFNESIGGTKNGYFYISDSNLDWGQDLKRLHVWVDKHQIETLPLHYFGGGDPEFELGSRYVEFSPDDTDVTGWVAVSASNYTISFEQDPTYAFLNERGELREVIGNSILLYYIPTE